MIKRDIKLPENRSFFLFGPRQTGKSTLLKSIFPNGKALYYDLLKSEEYTRLAARPQLLREEVLSRGEGGHVVIDEVQRIPELLNEVHHILETPGHPRFCMSGSSARKLKRAQANLLAGRAWTCRLHPLTHRECGPLFSLEKALRIGTLPSIYLEENEEDARRTLQSYVHTYLKEELEAEAAARNIGSFLRFLPIAAGENGNLINYSGIARETGATYKAVQEHFRLLEDTLLGFMLMPFTRRLKRKLTKHPKFYFFDPGVQRAIAGKLSVPLERGTSEHGRAFEHFVILEIARLADYAGKGHALSFYRTEGHAEVDLVVECPDGRVCAIEIKASDDANPGRMRGLASLREALPEASLLCASLAPRARMAGGIRILPWQDIFECLGL